MLKNKPLLLAAAVACVTALTSLSAQAFWGPFNMFRGWGGDPWYGGYPYYGYPWYGGYPYYGYPYYGGWGYPHYGGWGYPYGWAVPHLAYPVAPAPAAVTSAKEAGK